MGSGAGRPTRPVVAQVIDGQFRIADQSFPAAMNPNADADATHEWGISEPRGTMMPLPTMRQEQQRQQQKMMQAREAVREAAPSTFSPSMKDRFAAAFFGAAKTEEKKSEEEEAKPPVLHFGKRQKAKDAMAAAVSEASGMGFARRADDGVASVGAFEDASAARSAASGGDMFSNNVEVGSAEDQRLTASQRYGSAIEVTDNAYAGRGRWVWLPSLGNGLGETGAALMRSPGAVSVAAAVVCAAVMAVGATVSRRGEGAVAVMMPIGGGNAEKISLEKIPLIAV